ncbi:methionyl-tRNA formyltransferase [Micromonospora sp. R77]|uniref:methionyl-tRNA formyltransferase n=1 Tax=Micromonospora sp. R77 TaxID=2925836 RepID=UPI001F614681|nr:methionyl-tRNA formyltransferase [Micromonospora sp. R77]MCI4065269.1 methionyl-tRNA formyltransferase [Micromonospora sp. R77]
MTAVTHGTGGPREAEGSGMTKRIVWVSFDTIGRACLEAAAEVGAEVAGVVTLPGPVRPEVSGMCRFDDVAERYGAELIEARNVNDPECVAAVRRLAPDTLWVVGWSQLLRDELLAVPRAGTFGMHPTLLPRHRGRAPIPWAILTGLARTGVTLFEIPDATADSGAVIGQSVVEIAPDETAGTLFAKCADAHVELVREYFPQIAAGTAPRFPQDPTRASHWPKRTPADGLIDWETRAGHLDAWVRAQTRPYPGAFTWLGDRRVVIWQARPEAVDHSAVAGAVLAHRRDGVLVAAGDGALLLREVSVDGSAPARDADLHGLLAVGAVLG